MGKWILLIVFVVTAVVMFFAMPSYINNDTDTLMQIRYTLEDLNIGYKSSTFKNWNTQAKKKMYDPDAEEEEVA